MACRYYTLEEEAELMAKDGKKLREELDLTTRLSKFSRRET